MTNYSSGFRCLGCGKDYPPDYEDYICGSCSQNLDVIYDYDAIRRVFSAETLKNNPDRNVWRYKPLFPFEKTGSAPDLDFSLTPLYKCGFLEEETGLDPVYLKDDTRLPSASFKDRASSVVMAVAREKGIKVVSAASTGNAGCS